MSAGAEQGRGLTPDGTPRAASLAAEAAQPVGPPGGALLRDLLIASRPAQWSKNLLLFAAFVFSARSSWTWREPDQWLPLLVSATAAFVLFSVLSSGTYLINDVLDAERDRAHPRKRRRPIAAGRIGTATASIVGGALIGVALGGAFALDVSFGLWAAAYIAVTAAYSVALKHVVIIDVIAIATGFAIRAIAGAAVIDVPISPWLYVCTTLGALFIASTKRRQEVVLLEGDAFAHRGVLSEYSIASLDQISSVAMSASIVSYALYATTAENLPQNNAMLLTLPFVLYGLFRFRLIAERSPERNADELIARDLPLLANVALFAVTALAVLAFDR